MATLLGPLLAAMILAQASVRPPIAGEVVDDQGKPVVDASVVFYVPPSVSGKEYQAEAQAKTDAAGQFGMNRPSTGRMFVGGINWSSFDPRAAVARLEKIAIGADPSPSDVRIRVASLVGLSDKRRLQSLWPD